MTLAIAGLACISGAQPKPPKYEVVNRFSIPGEEGWDYLTFDHTKHRLFISRGTHVQVMDTKTGKIVGDIPNTPGVHGIALAPKENLGFTSNGRENTVTVFEYDTLKEVKRIKVGENPDAIVYDSKSQMLFTMNGRSNDVSIIDIEKMEVVGTAKVSGKPEFAAPDEKGSLFVNIEDKNVVEKIDIESMKSVESYPLAPGEEPTGMAIDRHNGKLYSVCGNGVLTVLNFKTGKLIGKAPIGNGADAAAWDSDLELVFSSNGADGTLTVIAPKDNGTYPVVQTVKTQKSARTMAVDRRENKVYLIAAEFEAPAAGQRRGKMKPGSAVIIVVAAKE